MSMVPTSGVVVSAAGLALAQSSGPDALRAQQAATVQQRHVQSELRAEDTAGIAKTDGENQQANDRDADGRLPWHFGPPSEHAAGQQPLQAHAEPHMPKDPLGESGNQLDLTG